MCFPSKEEKVIRMGLALLLPDVSWTTAQGTDAQLSYWPCMTATLYAEHHQALKRLC